MKVPAWIVIVVVAAEVACACKGSSRGPGTGPGTGSGSGSGSLDASACDGQLEHVRALYQAAAARTAMKDMTEAEVGDNVAMVMTECKAAPAKVVPCLARVTAVAQLEHTCLPALDDDGREGQVFLGK